MCHGLSACLGSCMGRTPAGTRPQGAQRVLQPLGLAIERNAFERLWLQGALGQSCLIMWSFDVFWFIGARIQA